MGLFDKLFNSSNDGASYGFNPINEMDAWVGIFYACASVDGNVSELESEMLTNRLVYKSWFDTATSDNLFRPYKQAASSIGSMGSKLMIDKSVPFISEDRKETLFCFIVEVLMVDGVLHDEEKNILEYLQSSLEISEEIAVKVLQVYFMRNKGNLILED